MSTHTITFTDIDELNEILSDERTLYEAENIVDRVAIDAELAKLGDEERDMIYLLYTYKQPKDYPREACWPAGVDDICRYLGEKYHGGVPIPVRTLWYRHEKVIKRWKVMHAFYSRYARLNDTVEQMAERFSSGDLYLKKELIQRGLELLWKIKLPKQLTERFTVLTFQFTEEEERYIKRSLRNRMRKFLKRELKLKV